nr:hypothetical protein [Tanacetum cinerariifolium]
MKHMHLKDTSDPLMERVLMETLKTCWLEHCPNPLPLPVYYLDVVLELNAFDDNGIEVMRNKIKMCAQKKVFCPPGMHNLIILDEADGVLKNPSHARLMNNEASMRIPSIDGNLKWYCIFLMNGLHVVVLLADAPAIHVTQGLLIGHEKSSTKGLDYLYPSLINLRVASNAINARRLPLALLVFVLMTTTVVNNSLFKTFFEKQKLTENDFMEWYRNLRIALSVEGKLPFLEQPIPAMPVPPAGQVTPPNVLATHFAWVKAQKEIAGRSGTSLDRGRISRVQTGRRAGCKLLRSQNEELYRQLGTMGKTVTKLHAMLKLHEKTLPPKEVAPALHVIRARRIQKNQKKKSHKAAKGNQGKGKSKIGYAHVQVPPFPPKPKNPPTPKKDNLAKDAICHQCGEVGHWKRNCPIYLVELMKIKKLSQGAITSGIFTIELYSFPSTSWVYDMGCGTHICITTQGLKGSRKLKPEALSLYVGDGHRAVVEAIKEFHLCLPNGLVLILHNCHYAPSITRGIISVLRLYKDGFVNRFENDNSISVSKNNLTYFNAIRRDDIYEIVLLFSNTNDSSMHADYAIEFAAHILNMVPTKKVDKTSYEDTQRKRCSFYYPPENKVFVARNAEFFHNDIIDQEASGSLEDLEYIQKEDMHPSIDTSLNHEKDDQEIDEPQSDINPIRRDLGKPANYKAALLDPESDKWLNAMNVEMQSMKDNEVWELVDLLPNSKTVGRKWLFKKKTDMDGAVHTYKTRLNPGEVHGTTVKNILKYLRNTKDMFLVYGGDTKRELRVSCYTDAGYLTDADDMKSQTRYVFVLNGGVFVLNGGAVAWKRKKQSIFATSSADAGYIAAFDASKEAVWIHKFISGLGVVPTIEEPINMYRDNTRAIAITKDHGVTKGAIHFRVKVYYLRETIEMGVVRIEKVDTYDNLADPFTKALTFTKHSELTDKIGMIPTSGLM